MRNAPLITQGNFYSFARFSVNLELFYNKGFLECFEHMGSCFIVFSKIKYYELKLFFPKTANLADLLDVQI